MTDPRADDPGFSTAVTAATPRRFGLPHVLYPNAYTWYVLVASLDIMFTWMILYEGGRELNALADWIIERHGLPGIVIFKFAMLLVVVSACEVIGRARPATGRKLAEWSVAITLIPVILGGVQLLLHVLR